MREQEGAGGSVRIPDGVSKIADSAFSRCSGVTEVVVPDSVTEICSHAFFAVRTCGGPSSLRGCPRFPWGCFGGANSWRRFGFRSM